MSPVQEPDSWSPVGPEPVDRQHADRHSAAEGLGTRVPAGLSDERPESEGPGPESSGPEGPRTEGPEAEAQPGDGPKTKNRRLRWAIEIVVILIAALVVALLVQQFLVKPFAIPSPSMEMTLVEGDRVLVNRLVYHFRSPKRGDVIVFHPPGKDESAPFIKRIVAVGGDTVAVRDGCLYLNGYPQDEPYIKEYPIRDDHPETTIPPKHVWVLGDNRNNSGDSRVFGPVREDAIMGKAFLIYWPLNRIGRL